MNTIESCCWDPGKHLYVNVSTSRRQLLQHDQTQNSDVGAEVLFKTSEVFE